MVVSIYRRSIYVIVCYLPLESNALAKGRNLGTRRNPSGLDPSSSPQPTRAATTVTRYFWTPWDIDPSGTRTWPADFNRIQEEWKLDSSYRQTNSVHSIDNAGRIIVVSGPPAYVADHMSVPETIAIGSGLKMAWAWVEAGRHPRAREFASHFDQALAVHRKVPRSSMPAMLARFMPDQVVRQKTSQRSGTFTETWTGSDGDPWPSHWTNTELDTLDLLGTKPVAVTIDINASNQGEYAGPSGGALKRIGYTFAYNGETAIDMNVTAHYAARSEMDGPAVRIEVGSGHDTFYYLQNRAQYGDDTRLFKIIDETRTQIATSSRGSVAAPHDMRLVIENDGSGDPAMDGKIWSGTEPGTPDISHTDTEIDAITGSGYGGIYGAPTRNLTTTVDDFQFTNNDLPVAGVKRRNLSSLGVGS